MQRMFLFFIVLTDANCNTDCFISMRTGKPTARKIYLSLYDLPLFIPEMTWLRLYEMSAKQISGNRQQLFIKSLPLPQFNHNYYQNKYDKYN